MDLPFMVGRVFQYVTPALKEDSASEVRSCSMRRMAS